MLPDTGNISNSTAFISDSKVIPAVSVIQTPIDVVSETESEASLPQAAHSVSPVAPQPMLSQRKCETSRAKRTLAAFSLEGKVCVVTGGASGIGLGICKSILESGGQVAIVDLNVVAAHEQAKQLVETYEQENHEEVSPLVTSHAADVASPASIDLAINSVLSKHGHIDHLVTCAGICENISAIDYPHSRMQKLWSINVDGSFYFATAVARHLMQRKSEGSIVLIGSMSGSIVNVPQMQAPYNISKAAVKQMARTLGVEWAEYGIRVNCISPGYVRTALTDEIIKSNPALYAEWVSRTPVKRLGKPSDIAGAVVFLLSDLSTYMTGSEILIDGGYTSI
ncbi:uncharacterized protein PV09_08621 [Verruconis gallopava]|uniref:NADP-dependent mannitol dehydrogenase n=1 Tax=Verruconis gallopava TaxID=253628 RepID=A0A0D1ZZF3_9PEZI|nr:uncharacterized protein PV09_08621 [Verruconis gallopava]KIV99817.1 hypothetical protein PV09_08621 [Verruconis gallopava]